MACVCQGGRSRNGGATRIDAEKAIDSLQSFLDFA
jgi:hypothetical protein